MTGITPDGTHSHSHGLSADGLVTDRPEFKTCFSCGLRGSGEGARYGRDPACRRAPAPSTERSGLCSNAGIRGWPMMVETVPARRPPREHPRESSLASSASFSQTGLSQSFSFSGASCMDHIGKLLIRLGKNPEMKANQGKSFGCWTARAELAFGGLYGQSARVRRMRLHLDTPAIAAFAASRLLWTALQTAVYI